MSSGSPSPAVVSVSGFARGRFEPLADVLGRLAAAQGGGLALAIRRDGEPVVDLVAGEYASDSLQLIFSVSKSVTAIAAALAHQEGLLDLDAPLGDVWPEFAKPSTSMITTRMVLSHRSGLPAVDHELTLDELVAGGEEALLERQEPYWQPGTRHGYHAFTYGTFLDGVFRRTVGTRVGEFVADRLSGPLGLDLWIGAPEEVYDRIHSVAWGMPRTTADRAARATAPGGIPPGSTGRLARRMDVYNDPRTYRAGWPSSSGIADARSLAALFSAVLDDGVILTSATRAEMVASRARGEDAVLGVPMHYGSGVQLAFPAFPLLGPTSFGHEAAGGSAAFADPEGGLSVGFTTSVAPQIGGAAPAFLALLPVIRHCLTADATTI